MAETPHQGKKLNQTGCSSAGCCCLWDHQQRPLAQLQNTGDQPSTIGRISEESRVGITARWMDQASLLSETPCAEPHAGCCGGWGLDTPGYPIIAFSQIFSSTTVFTMSSYSSQITRTSI